MFFKPPEFFFLTVLKQFLNFFFFFIHPVVFMDLIQYYSNNNVAIVVKIFLFILINHIKYSNKEIHDYSNNYYSVLEQKIKQYIKINLLYRTTVKLQY